MKPSFKSHPGQRCQRTYAQYNGAKKRCSSNYKRERSAVGAGDNDEVVFVSATKLRTLKEEPGLKREHSAVVPGNKDDKDLVLISVTKRRRSNTTVNNNSVEVIDLT